MKSSQNLELIILGIVLIISIFVICMVLCVPKAYGEGFSGEAGNYKSLRRMALRSAPNGLTPIERLRLAREHVENREKNVDGE